MHFCTLALQFCVVGSFFVLKVELFLTQGYSLELCCQGFNPCGLGYIFVFCVQGFIVLCSLDLILVFYGLIVIIFLFLYVWC